VLEYPSIRGGGEGKWYIQKEGSEEPSIPQKKKERMVERRKGGKNLGLRRFPFDQKVRGGINERVINRIRKRGAITNAFCKSQGGGEGPRSLQKIVASDKGLHRKRGFLYLMLMAERACTFDGRQRS